MDLTSFGAEKKNNAPTEISQTKLNVDMKNIQKSHKQEEVERFLPWFMKYQLKDISTLPKTKAIKKIDEFFEKKDFKKGLLLVGAPGCGKTSTLRAYANHYNYEIVELNASDMRSKKSIAGFLNEIVRAKSLFNQDKLILIDEADGISGTYDRGGVNEIISIMKTSTLPFCFTANIKESNQVKALKKVATVIDFEEHTKELHKYIAQNIFEKENINYEESKLLEFIEKHKSSDIRGFINDLQASCIHKDFNPTDIFEKRSYKSKIEQLVNDIIHSPSAKEAIQKASYQDVQVDDIVSYLEETITQLKPNSRLKALLELSKADTYKKRIYKWQYWRYLVYIYFYATYAQNPIFRKFESLEPKENKRLLQSWIFGSKVQSLKGRTRLQKNKGEDKTSIEEFSNLIHRSYHKTRIQELQYLHLFMQDEELVQDLEERGILDDKVKSSLSYCFS